MIYTTFVRLTVNLILSERSENKGLQFIGLNKARTVCPDNNSSIASNDAIEIQINRARNSPQLPVLPLNSPKAGHMGPLDRRGAERGAGCSIATPETRLTVNNTAYEKGSKVDYVGVYFEGQETLLRSAVVEHIDDLPSRHNKHDIVFRCQALIL